MIIIKQRTVSDVTGDSDPTTSVIPVGSEDSNNSGSSYPYIWRPIPGFSRPSGLVTVNGWNFPQHGIQTERFWFEELIVP